MCRLSWAELEAASVAEELSRGMGAWAGTAGHPAVADSLASFLLHAAAVTDGAGSRRVPTGGKGSPGRMQEFLEESLWAGAASGDPRGAGGAAASAVQSVLDDLALESCVRSCRHGDASLAHAVVLACMRRAVVAAAVDGGADAALHGDVIDDSGEARAGSSSSRLLRAHSEALRAAAAHPRALALHIAFAADTLLPLLPPPLRPCPPVLPQTVSASERSPLQQHLMQTAAACADIYFKDYLIVER